MSAYVPDLYGLSGADSSRLNNTLRPSHPTNERLTCIIMLIWSRCLLEELVPEAAYFGLWVQRDAPKQVPRAVTHLVEWENESCAQL